MFANLSVILCVCVCVCAGDAEDAGVGRGSICCLGCYLLIFQRLLYMIDIVTFLLLIMTFYDGDLHICLSGCYLSKRDDSSVRGQRAKGVLICPLFLIWAMTSCRRVSVDPSNSCPGHNVSSKTRNIPDQSFFAQACASVHK